MRLPPHSINSFGISKHFLNPIWVTEALNRPQKGPNMELNSKFSQPYSQYSVQARAYVPSCLSLVNYIILNELFCAPNAGDLDT